MNKNIKKKQHFVSQFYLKNWQFKEDTIYVLREGKIIPQRIKEIAHSNLFYKIKGMDQIVFDILKRQSHKIYKTDLVNTVLRAFEFGLEFKEISKYFPDLENDIKLYQSNVIEDIYSYIEDIAKFPCAKILDKKFDQLTSDDYRDILLFSVIQLTRTKKPRSDFMKIGLEDNSGVKILNSDQTSTYHMFQSLFIASQIHINLLEKMYRIRIIESKSKLNFITSDNPCFNHLYVDGQPDFELIFPLSPKFLLIITPSNLSELEIQKIKNDKLKNSIAPPIDVLFNFEPISDDNYLISLNELIAKYKDMELYAYSEEDLKLFI